MGANRLPLCNVKCGATRVKCVGNQYMVLNVSRGRKVVDPAEEEEIISIMMSSSSGIQTEHRLGRSLEV